MMEDEGELKLRCEAVPIAQAPLFDPRVHPFSAKLSPSWSPSR